MKLPALGMQPAPPWQRRRLAQWLSEWRAERLLSQPEHEHPAATSLAPDARLAASAPEDRPAAAGQIRLLAPVNAASSSRPIYVALLRREPRQAWLVAPFSRFSVPADPCEFLTGRAEPCVRVLAAGLARPVPAAMLAHSWFVDELAARETREALAVYEYACYHDPLPRTLTRRLGPPVWHPDDPRRVYRHRQRALLDAALGVHTRLIYLPRSQSGLSKAAERSADYRPRRRGRKRTDR